MSVNIPTELQEFLKGKQGWVVAAARDGTPNVSIKGSLRLLDDGHLIFADIFSLNPRLRSWCTRMVSVESIYDQSGGPNGGKQIA